MRGATRAGIVLAAGIMSLVVPPSTAHASGFFLLEESARLQGTSYAGTAALAADASTVFYNPAGMSRIKNWSIATSGYLVSIQSELEDATATNFGQPVFGPNGRTSAGAGTDSAVGAVMIAKRLTDTVVAGFAFTAPFGLSYEYGGASIARFVATKSKLVTYNLQPSLSWEFYPGMSIGAGVDVIQADVALNQKLQPPGFDELNVRLQADDWTVGWNAGVLWEITEDYRVGFAYRSPLTFGLRGTAKLTPNPQFDSLQNAKATTTFPDTWTLSGVAMVSPRWQLLGDLQWIHWARIQDVGVIFRPRGAGQGGAILPNQELPFNFRNTFRGAIGTQYFHDEEWTFRGGVAFDQAASTDRTRTARLPDANRILLSVGIGYNLTRQMAVDVAYTHIFIPGNVELNQTGFGTTLTGHYESSVDLFGLQLTFTFDEGLPFIS
ncbi:MAG: outer membrane protein transport protein [Thermodesulfobacteriota bacterium]